MSAILLSLTLLGAAAQVQTRETPTTRLFVQTTPPGATIKLDGKAEGTAPKMFLVPPGANKMIVEVELDGHASECREVTVEGGRVTRIEFQLEPKTLKIEAEVSEIRLFLQDFEWALALSGAAAKKAKVLPPRLKEDLALLFIREKRLKCSDEQNARLDQIRSEYALKFRELRNRRDALTDPRLFRDEEGGPIVAIGREDEEGGPIVAIGREVMSLVKEMEGKIDNVLTDEQRTQLRAIGLATRSTAKVPDKASTISAAAELKALQGEWKVTRVEKGEAAGSTWPLMDPPFHKDSMNPENIDRLQITEGGLALLDHRKGQRFVARYRVDPTTTPGRIDLVTSEGFGEERKERIAAVGIYEVGGDRLKVCLAQYHTSLEAEQSPTARAARGPRSLSQCRPRV